MPQAYNLVDRQALNIMLGQQGFDIIQKNLIWLGNWSAIRLVEATNVIVNEVDLSILNLLWIIGLYFYCNITRIENNSNYAILAYRSGITLCSKI